MKISDDMYKQAIENKTKFNIIDEEYVLLYKKMPCTDNDLDNYISSLNKLREEGANVCNILDYRLVEGTTHKFSDNVSYTTGVFLEKRAKGKCIADVDNINLKSYNNYDFKMINYMYDKLMDFYVGELENRANSKQEVFDKLISDYMSFNKYGLEPDPKPLNFFYDKNEGYSIIDVIPSKEKSVDLKYLSRCIFFVVFGYRIPMIYIDLNRLDIITIKFKDRIDKILPVLEEKLISSLVKVGVSRDDLISNIQEFRDKFNNLSIIDNNIEDYLSNILKKEKDTVNKNVK